MSWDIREILAPAFGEITYACCVCGVREVSGWGQACDLCQEPEAA